jgi:hypothetical protein
VQVEQRETCGGADLNLLADSNREVVGSEKTPELPNDVDFSL